MEETEGFKVQSQLQLQSELKARLGYTPKWNIMIAINKKRGDDENLSNFQGV